MPVDHELQAQLDREAASGLPPRSERSVALTRELYRKSAPALGGDPVPLPRVEPLAAGPIPLRLYAASASGPLPAMVYFHGGRFFSGDLDTHDALCRKIAQESGCGVVAVDYRLAPERPFPAAVDDCYDAVQWVAGNAAALGLDPAHLAVGGDSAGACLAAVTALLARDRGGPAVRAQWLIYPMLDPGCGLDSHEKYAEGFGPGSKDMLRGWKEYLPLEVPAADARITPLYARCLTNLPPAYVLTAEYDTLHDEGKLFAKRLRDSGVAVEEQCVDGAIHGFFQMPAVSQLARTWIAGASLALRGLLVDSAH